MVVRLWWKEARLFWPIAAFLAVLSVAAQGLLVHYLGKDAQTGLLPLFAFGSTCLFGFAVASASLAGERENHTLLLLDALPVARWRLWGAKASFAVGSTLALGLALGVLASLSTESWDLLPQGWAVWGGLVVVLQVLGWGLFWSAICEHALVAAALAVCSMGLTLPLLFVGMNLKQVLDRDLPVQLAVALATVVASAVFFIRSGPARRPLFSRCHVPRRRPIKSFEEARTRSRGLFPAWPRAAASLAWQTGREIAWLAVRLALVALFVPVLLAFWTSRRSGDPFFWGFFNLGVGILAGVNMLGTEYGARTRRFLAHHGARPGMVWLVKTSLWFAALALVWLATAVFWPALDLGWGPRQIPREVFIKELVTVTSLLFTSAAIGQLCGMVFPRGITAAMVAVVALIAMNLPLFYLLGTDMLPLWVMPAVPPVILAAGWAWSGEWLLERQGMRRWVKLLLLLLGGFGALFAGYAYDRANGLPSLDPRDEARLFAISSAPRAVSRDGDAHEIYAEALRRLSSNVQGTQGSIAQDVAENGWEIRNAAGTAYLRENAGVLDQVRRASAMAAPRIIDLDRATIFFRTVELIEYTPKQFMGLLALSVRERQARGDVAGAWEDLLVMFRMARQWSGAVPLQVAFSGAILEREALGLAMLWAADSRQTALTLRSALDSYQKLSPMPSAAEPVRAEARIARNTTDLPRSELAEMLLAMNGRRRTPWTETVTDHVMITPWELARARKVLTILFAAKIAQGEKTPQPAILPRFSDYSEFQSRLGLQHPLLQSTPLAKLWFPAFDSYFDYWNRNEVGRRALVQILALRSWQVRHGGRLPEELGELVPSELENLPEDPYRKNQPFGYVRSAGQLLLPLGAFGPLTKDAKAPKPRPTDGFRLLYSVGPDFQDDKAQMNDPSEIGRGDIIFPLRDSK